MALNDQIADMLTRIRNAKTAKHKFVDITFSKLNVSLVESLKELGYLNGLLVDEEKRKIRVFLRYKPASLEPVISGIKRASKCGQRKYVGYREIPMVLSGLGNAILSTPKGIIDGKKAKQLKVGGELLCYVW